MVRTTTHAANICVATILGGKQEMNELQRRNATSLEQQTWQQLLETQLISLSGSAWIKGGRCPADQETLRPGISLCCSDHVLVCVKDFSQQHEQQHEPELL